MAYLAHKRAHVLSPPNDEGNRLRSRHFLARNLRYVHERNSTDSLILFGYPGAGKSSIIEGALKDLHDAAHGDFDIVEISCTGLISEHPDATSALLSLSSQLTGYMKSVPDLRVFVLDETDAIGSRRDQTSDSAQRSLCHLCMRVLETSYQRVFWLLITNHPNLLDEAIRDRVGKKLYLDFPDRDAVSAILTQWLERDDADAILGSLMRPDVSYEISTRALVRGLDFLASNGWISARKIKDCTGTEAAEHIRAVAGFPNKDEAERYRMQYREFIAQSELLMRALGF